ncbi:MAG: hypothetical protein M1840_002970 [Geoglossum simile]|nr:MAG: hypothetical protein M1840_002970 [Geoglossum simile]
MFFKVKSWQDNMEQESETIKFVKERFGSIPVPEIIHSRTESASQRMFLVLKPVPGETLEEAWTSLSPDQRRNAALQTAHHRETLAKVTSHRLQSALGYAITDRFLIAPSSSTEPSWKPVTLGPLSVEKAKAHLFPLQIGWALT